MEKIFKDLPTTAKVTAFDKGGACGFVVQWTEQEFGFGELTFYMDKDSGEFRGKSECLFPEHVGRILARLDGTTVGWVGEHEPLED